MMPVRSTILCTLLIALTTLPAQAKDITSELTPKLRDLLQQEMTGVETAMKDVYSAIIRGNHDVVHKKGQAIHDSFILDQKLTKQDRKDLKSAVPKSFLKLDQRFHKQAEKLAEAGNEENTQKQKQLFDRMTDACVSCHTRFVNERFSGLDQ